MPSFDLEPDKFFSQQQWAEIAQTIERDQIPREAKQRICDALFEYTMATIKPEKLRRFVEDARQFRATASRIQNFLTNFRWHTKIEELIEEIYQVQRFLDEEFKRRPNPKGGLSRSRYFGLSSGSRVYGPHWRSAKSNCKSEHQRIEPAFSRFHQEDF
jgi:hypothetical protein